MSPAPTTTEARLFHLEQEGRELRGDIRALTTAVSDLARTVAVLAERVSHLAQPREAPAAAAPAAGLPPSCPATTPPPGCPAGSTSAEASRALDIARQHGPAAAIGTLLGAAFAQALSWAAAR